MTKLQRRHCIVALGALVTASNGGAQTASSRPTRIGILVGGSVAQRGHLEQAMLAGLIEQGLVEGKNLVIERRYADGRGELVPEYARELAALKLDAVVSTCTPSTLAAKSATSSTPIVMAAVADPVGQQLIASLARPGGNLTGLSSQAEDILPKMLEFFGAVLPRQATVAVLTEAKSQVHPRMWLQLQPLAEALRLRVVRVDVASPADLPPAFERALRAAAQAAFVLPDEPMFLSRRSALVELAAKHRLPAFYGAREFVDDGGLMSYGESLRGAYRDVGVYIGQLARGAKAAELPVQQPTRFELVINLKTAEALGISFPQALRLRADAVLS